MKRSLAITAVTTILVLGSVAAPASACACGGPAPQPGTEVNVDREVSIVRWDGADEEITMRLDMVSDAGETGLIVPTPAPATVTSGDPAVFDALEAQIAPRPIVEDDWWGPNPFTFGTSAGAPDGGAAPEVLARVQLGPIEAVTLAASDTQGLSDWLDENGFELSDAIDAQLDPYVADGWSFVALRIIGDVPLDGELDPIRFTFASDELVYPMRMSRAADTPQDLRLYVIGDHRYSVVHLGGEPLTTQNTTYWAGAATEAEVVGLGAYLTVLDLHWGNPATEITSDLQLEVAPGDEAVSQDYYVTHVVTILGIPAGVFIVIVSVLALVLALVITITIRRRRAHT